MRDQPFITDNAPGLLSVYVVHVATAGATACQSKATKPACMTATYLSDTNPFGVVIGDSQRGAVAYGSCLSGPIHVQTINFFGTEPRPVCTYTVTCDPNAGYPDCALGNSPRDSISKK